MDMQLVVKIGLVVLVISAYIFRKQFEELLGGKDSSSPDPVEDISQGSIDELGKIARDFGFLYEKTYLFINNESNEDERYLISEWEVRIKTNSEKYLITLWQSLIQKYFNLDFYKQANTQGQEMIKNTLSEWMKLLKEFGIRRDDRHEIIIENNTVHYVYSINGDWKIGDTLVVKQPAWFFKEKSVEKGVAEVLK